MRLHLHRPVCLLAIATSLGSICAAALFLSPLPAAAQTQRRQPIPRSPQTPASNAATPIPAGNFAISGTAVNAVTGEPLPHARIMLTDTREAHQPLRLITGDDGRFAFIRLPAGKFSVRGAKRGFVPAFYEQHEQFSTAIVTGAEFDTQNLTLRLMPLGFIYGKVLDESGEPLRAANVSLFRRFTNSGLTHIERVSNDVADDQGYYEFPAVPPGDYYIAATAKPWYAFHPAITTDAENPAPASSSTTSSPLDVSYPVTYYNGATDSDSATLITVKGADRQQLDLHLHPVPSLHLVYRIPAPDPQSDAQGYSTPNLQKRVFGVPENINAEERCINNVCEISGVPAGHYTVMQWQAGSSRTAEIDLAQDGQEIDISQSKTSAEVTLHVKLPSDDLPPQRIFLGLQGSDRRRVFGQNSLNEAGEVKLSGVTPGDYNILVGAPDKPYAVTRIAIGATEVPGRSISVPSGGAVEATVYLSAGVVNLEGVVKRGAKPASGIMVALIPQDRPEQNLQLFRRDQSDLDGSFILRGIIPGSYTLIAVEDAWDFEWLNPDALSRYLPHGQNVNITEHMHGSILLPDPVQVLPR